MSPPRSVQINRRTRPPRFDERQHRLQTLAARHVHHHPRLTQQLPRLVRIPPRPFKPPWFDASTGRGLPEPVPGGASAYVQGLAHAIGDDVPVLLRRLRVLVPETQGDPMLRCHADPVFHEISQTDRPGFALILDEAPLHTSRPKHEARRIAPHSVSASTIFALK